ncbi:MAG: hypothetical protein KDK99_08875 [Verrucomicrobiales bacterium]|nr:hypothetical protein [Verrucomicrobiales bacterium]
MKPDYLGTWKEMIATLGKDFPCMAPNLTGELSRAIMPSGQYQSVVQQKRMQQWQTVQLHQIKVRDHDMFLGMMLRSILLVDPDEMEIHEVLTYWKEVQRIMEVKLRPNPVRSAVGLAGVAEQILNHPDSDFSGYGQPEENPLAIARKLLEESTRIAPQLKENGLALLRVLTEMKDHSARNKLLDQLSVRYPDSKEVLLWAGTQAVERKAFGKGIKSLRAACTLDPLDSNARQTLLWGLISQARDLSKKKKDTDALWGEILTHATDRSESDPFLQTRWSMLLRRGILSQDEGLIQHGQELAPSTLLALCFESTMRINYAEPPRKGWLAEWSLALKSSPQWQDLVDLLALRKWATLLPNQRGREVYDCTNHLDEVSDALFAKSLSSDSAGLLAMLTALAPLGSGRRETGMDFDLKIRLTRFYSELNRYKERPREYPYLCVAYWWLTPFGVDPMRARQALPILLEARIAFSEMENAGKSGLTVLEKLVPMVEKMVDQFKDHQIPDPKPKSKRKKAAKPKAPRKKVEPPTEEDMQRVPPAALPWLVKLANALLDDEAERVKQICAELEACGMEWELIEKFLKTPPKRLKEDDPSLKPPPASSFDQLELF